MFKHITRSAILFLTISPLVALAQWNTSGANIYNTNTGNVGIGTTTPASTLHIKKARTLSELTATPINDMMRMTLNAPDGFTPANTVQRLVFNFQDWGTNEATYGAMGVEKEADGGGIYGGGKINFYTYGPARGANQPSPGLINTFSIDRFGNTSIMATVHYSYIPAVNNILKLRFYTPNVQTPYGVENRISFTTKALTNGEVETGVISVKVGDEEPGSYAGGEMLFYTRDSSPGGGLPGAGLLERMRIDNKGRVGIGTNNPDQPLTVKGTIHTNDVLVNMDGPLQGPDYVFEKDYNLLPLAELEAYINQNKHLPEVPSAKEMEANGLNLKEMNLLLLKKVEELTLHVIEKDKKLTALEKRIEQLEKH